MSIKTPAMSESALKLGCEQYLTYLQNAGKLVYIRLNAGDFILQGKEGEFRRRVKGARKGTADLLVIYGAQGLAQIVFLELKSTKGKQSPEQKGFQAEVEAHGCRYFIVRSQEELEKILEGVPQ
ncbi:MAG: VRR-NUC domain-containing protein [Dehalococcoidales bacterium]|nr:VRR-NUC domain-containing protein [Dehalococcoidales bacterium]